MIIYVMACCLEVVSIEFIVFLFMIGSKHFSDDTEEALWKYIVIRTIITLDSFKQVIQRKPSIGMGNIPHPDRLNSINLKKIVKKILHSKKIISVAICGNNLCSSLEIMWPSFSIKLHDFTQLFIGFYQLFNLYAHATFPDSQF